MPRPRGNDGLPDDLRRLRQDGVDVIVSALTGSETEELGLASESHECCRNKILYISFPIEDRCLPAQLSDFANLMDQVVEYAKESKSIVIHSRAGIGCSSLIAASVLVKMGLSPAVAFEAIELPRGCPVPDTAEQRQWVERYSDFLKTQTS